MVSPQWSHEQYCGMPTVPQEDIYPIERLKPWSHCVENDIHVDVCIMLKWPSTWRVGHTYWSLYKRKMADIVLWSTFCHCFVLVLSLACKWIGHPTTHSSCATSAACLGVISPWRGCFHLGAHGSSPFPVNHSLLQSFTMFLVSTKRSRLLGEEHLQFMASHGTISFWLEREPVFVFFLDVQGYVLVPLP